MGIVQRDAFKTMVLSYIGILIGYLNKGILFLIILNADQIGLVNLLLTVGLFFAQLANLGTINTVSKFFVMLRNEERGHYGFLRLLFTTIGIGIVITTVLTILLKGIVTEYYSSKSGVFITYYYWIIPIGIANVIFMLMDNYLRAMFKNVFAVFLYEIVLRLLLTLILTAFALELFDFDTFVVLFALIYFIPVVALLIYFMRIGELKHVRKRISMPKRLSRILANYGAFSYLNSLGAVAIVTIDATMIAALVGLAGTGVYTTVQFFTSALQVPFRSIFRVASPFVPLFWKERNMVKMNQLYKNVSSVSLFVSLGLFLLVWLNRVELFSLLPAGFEDSQWVFLFLMIGRLVDMYTGINVTILLTSKRYEVDIYLTVLMFVLVIVLNVLLIPPYGIIGASISTAIAIIASNILRLLYVLLKFNLHPFRWNQVVIIILGVAAIFINDYVVTLMNSGLISQIFVHQLIILVVFILPYWIFRLDPQVVDFVKKKLKGVKSSLFTPEK